MDICILFTLPDALSRQLLVKWLDFSSVVRMDSAMCASKVRRKYLSWCTGGKQRLQWNLINNVESLICYCVGRYQETLS
jgi:hypothetical protein